jgi:hypothetical protein
MWGELAEAHAEAGHEYDAITRACRRRGDESARREGVVDTAKRPFSAEERHAMLNGLVAPLPTPAPPADERAELVKRLRWGDPTFALTGEAANQIERDGARIAELGRERDGAVKIGHAFASDAEAAKARAEAAEALLAEIMAGHRGDNRQVTFHSGALLARVSAALAQKEPSNG